MKTIKLQKSAKESTTTMHSSVCHATIIILLVLKLNPIQAYGQKFTTNKNNVYYMDREQKVRVLIVCKELIDC